MITQYDAVAEIEAMKARRDAKQKARPDEPAPDPSSWSAAGEHAIRAEMERRLASRSASHDDTPAHD